MSQSHSSPYEALKAGFRRACIRRLVGDEKAAIAVLRDEIPSLVVAWAKTSELDSSGKKAKLKELFDDESARADELASAFDLFSSRFEVRVAELVRSEISSISSKLDESIKHVENSLGHLIKAQRDHQQKLPKSAGSLSQNQVLAPKSPANNNDRETDLMANIIEEIPGKVDKPEVTVESLKHGTSMIGDGLRFDEIEEMIDEILSSNS
jgi:hypothetical protein